MIRFCLALLLFFALGVTELFAGGGVAFVAPVRTRITPFRPNVGRVPVGVPARFFSPNFHYRHAGAAFVPAAAFIPSYGYGTAAFVPSRAFVPTYQAAAFAPAYAPAGGCANYFPAQAAFAPSYAPAVQFAPTGGCQAFFGY